MNFGGGTISPTHGQTKNSCDSLLSAKVTGVGPGTVGTLKSVSNHPTNPPTAELGLSNL